MMKKEPDFQKNWEQLRKQLVHYSEEAMDLAKRGEKEIVRLSKEGRLRFDATTLNMKKEQLCYLIGKEYVKAKYPATPTARMKDLIEELKEVSKKQGQLKRKMTRAQSSGSK